MGFRNWMLVCGRVDKKNRHTSEVQVVLAVFGKVSKQGS